MVGAVVAIYRGIGVPLGIQRMSGSIHTFGGKIILAVLHGLWQATSGTKKRCLIEAIIYL